MNNEQPSAQQRRNHASEIITSGHVWTAVWYVAWPTAINTLVQTAYNIINGVFVGRLPDAKDALAAIGIGGAVLMLIQFSLTVGISVGASALVARSVGSGNHDDADEATGQGVSLSLVTAAVSSVPLILFSRQIMQLFGAQGAVIPLGAAYTSILAWSSAPLFVYSMAQSALRSAGDVKSPLYAGAATIGINILFDWLLIFGIGPFPRMEVVGAAVSTGIARIAGMLITLWFLRRSTLGGSFRHLKPRWDWFARILNIGWPAVMQNLVWTGANSVFIGVLGSLGSQATAAQAAYTVALRIESIAFMPGVAYATAATPLVGQNLGAGKPDRAVHSAWVATGQAVAIMTTVAVAFLTVPHWLAEWMTTDKSVVPLIVWYLRINALSEPLLAVGMVLRGALQGAGETRIPMVLSVLTLWIFRLPLTWLLATRLGYGAVGAWIAMSASTVLSGILVAAYFRRGSWKNVKV